MWHIWKGGTFRVPITTLQRPNRQGSWGLIDIEANCRALLICRMWLQITKNGSAKATWFQEWNLAGPRAKPPHRVRKSTSLEYLYRYALDMVYIAPRGNDETLWTSKRRVYSTLHSMAAATRESREMRISQRSPDTKCKQVWKKPTHGLDVRGNHFHVVHSAT